MHFSFSHVFFQNFPIKKGEFILLNSPQTVDKAPSCEGAFLVS